VALVPNDVRPFYAEHGLAVEHLLTDNGREFCGTDAHPYELYLTLCGIQHRTTRVRRPQTNGFVKRFHQKVLNEFLSVKFRETFYTWVEELQVDLNAWLRHYPVVCPAVARRANGNCEHPHQGYRNQGLRPTDQLLQYLAQLPPAKRAA
jgi:transposase InsO family protein